MKTRLLTHFRIFAGRRGALAVAAAGLVSAALPALAQEDIYFSRTTPSQASSASSAISQEALDGLLAPIALYPDALLAQVLMAATYPMDVIEAARWQQEHPDLNGQALQDALDAFDWDPSVKSLATVPQVLQYMNDSPRWMSALGRAVIDDQPRVMATVQTLRQKAYAAGTLESNDKQTVRTDTVRKGERIMIEPASPQVVYVPVYDPYVVYGPWWWPSRPYYWGPPMGAAFVGGYYWGAYYYPSMALWGGFNWGVGMITINVPVYRTYYRRAPSRMGPNNAWRRPPSARGDYYHSPYSGRPSSYRATGRSEALSSQDDSRGGSWRGDGARGRSEASPDRGSSRRGSWRGDGTSGRRQYR